MSKGKLPIVVVFNGSYRRYDNIAWYKASGDVIPIVNIEKQENKRMQDFEIECIRDLDKQFNGNLHVYWEANLDIIFPGHQIYYNILPNCSAPTKNAKGFNFDYSFLDYTNFQRPYKVFSNFCSTWKNKVIPSSFGKSLKKRIVTSQVIFKDQKYTSYVPVQSNDIRGGRHFAKAILNKISMNLEPFKKYGQTRNVLTIPTTRLSAYLNFGCISIREAAEVMAKNEELMTELWWREFYNQICFFFKEMYTSQAFYVKRDYWSQSKQVSNTSYLSQWKKGTTGVPIVDASIRCLNQTGYLHNRGRMIVASFLVKDLGIDWRIGETYFASQLIDYYFPSNNGGWQYISGTGASSMMQSRKFDPWLQGSKYDPNANFIKQYIPELRHIPAKDIHMWYTKHDQYENVYIPPIEI